jgi:hypothetical protein
MSEVTEDSLAPGTRGRWGAAFDRWAARTVARIERRAPGWWVTGERERRVVQLLGIRGFSRWFWNGGSGRGDSFLRRQAGDRARRLAGLDQLTREIEAKHWVGLAACSLVPAAAWLLGRPWWAATLAGINLAGHGYPILSMRWIRGRLVALGVDPSATRMQRGCHAEVTSDV